MYPDDLWWVVLWDNKLYTCQDEPVMWSMAIDDYGPIPLCHDSTDY